MKNILILSIFIFMLAGCKSTANVNDETTTTSESNPLEIPDLYERKGQLATAVEWKNTQEKVAELKAKIANKPSDLKSRLQIATIYITEARITGEHPYYYPAIHKILDGVLKLDPQNFEATVLKSSVNLSQHKFQEAKILAEKARNINPNNAYVYGILVDANVELGNYQEAIAASDKMQSIKPSLESYARASYLREIHGDYKGAIEAMKLAVTAGLPGSEPQCWSRNTLADLYMKTGDLKTAEELYKTNLELRPSYAFSIAGLAGIQQEKKNYDEALRLLNSAVAILPEYSFHEQMGDIYALQGKREKAIEKYKEVKVMLAEDEASGHSVALEVAKVNIKLDELDSAEKYAMLEYAAR
ncbi:MAG TPA: tetratricopeptide repeat protein, partial [Flavisolibacter sp.]|nr:tetratricopeptide repeat protein [Flavisolibacter sp.]